MYKFIINPVNNKNVPIKSKLGKNILKKYLIHLGGTNKDLGGSNRDLGGSDTPERLSSQDETLLGTPPILPKPGEGGKTPEGLSAQDNTLPVKDPQPGGQTPSTPNSTSTPQQKHGNIRGVLKKEFDELQKAENSLMEPPPLPRMKDYEPLNQDLIMYNSIISSSKSKGVQIVAELNNYNTELAKKCDEYKNQVDELKKQLDELKKKISTSKSKKKSARGRSL